MTYSSTKNIQDLIKDN